MVGLFFLNMWGDRQVVPYYPRRTLSFGSEGKLEYSMKGVRNLQAQQQKAQSPSSSPQHYAVVVDETQIKVTESLSICKTRSIDGDDVLSLCSRSVFLVSIRSAAALHQSLGRV